MNVIAIICNVYIPIFQSILHLQYYYNNFTLSESQVYSLDFERCKLSLHRQIIIQNI